MFTPPFNIVPNCIKAVPLGSTNSHYSLRPYKSKVILGLNDVGYGTTAELGFWNGKNPPDNGYTVYLADQATASTISTFAFSNSTDLIIFANQLGAGASTTAQAIFYLINTVNALVMSYNLPDFPKNLNLVFSIFSGVTQSLPSIFSNLTKNWWCMGSANYTTYDNYFFTNGTNNLQLDGDAVVFDGTFNCSISNPANMPINDDGYTMVVWFYANTTTGIQGLVGWGNYGTDNQANAFILQNDTLVNSWWNNDLVVSASIQISTWYNAIASYDPFTNTRSIYLNGVLLGSDNPTGTHNVPTAANTTVGYAGTNTVNYQGEIQNVAVYNIPFTLTDAQNYYTSTLPLINTVSYHLMTDSPIESQDILTQASDYLNIQ